MNVMYKVRASVAQLANCILLLSYSRSCAAQLHEHKNLINKLV